MNYLAHAYLSFNDPGILFGNMISDFVKGRRQFDYPPMIRKGIVLHRAIDTFTDEHLITKELKKIFRPAYGLYAGAFTDVVFDHFLATDRGIFPDEKSLADFSHDVYVCIETGLYQAPTGFQAIFPYMKQYDWLYNYRLDNGMQQSFAGLVRRAKYMHDHQTAFYLFQQHRETIRALYAQFFPLLKKHAREIFDQLLKTD